MREGNITLILAMLTHFVLRYRRGASHVQCPCQISAIVGHLLQATTMELQSRQHHHTDSLGKTVRHEECSAFAVNYVRWTGIMYTTSIAPNA
ncbi:hypothetical protein GQ607_005324 [Colletotrichum asianum]|uniref:Zinc finger LSD1-type domain-containing protein n=1 Tax=Colletotrichum asianum TaxID=702518 RepID=A0A8H3WG86_9PEZI|nr:hypothetical protein GQ607_005324 [Colletotrichum asianum]